MKNQIIDLIIVALAMVQAFFAGAYFNEYVYGEDPFGQKLSKLAATLCILFAGVPLTALALPIGMIWLICVRINRYFSLTFFIYHVILKRKFKYWNEDLHKNFSEKYESMAPKWYRLNDIIAKKLMQHINANLDYYKGDAEGVYR